MHFIDTHAHLYLDEFRQDINEVVGRAKDQGIRKILLPNIDSSSILPLHNLTEKYPERFIPLMGLHPTFVKDNYAEELEKVLNQLEAYPYCGIGEIGIDLYWDKMHLEQQVIVFKSQLVYALQKNLPVVIHCRESFHEIMELMRAPEYSKVRGIFHAFTGNREQAEEITVMGFKLGIGGILTFKNSGLAEVIKCIPLEHIVLETDSPYLAPAPFRGKRNESSYIRLIAAKLAEIKELSLDEVAAVTSRNAEMIFSL
jgi:TatD DNase family protein